MSTTVPPRVADLISRLRVLLDQRNRRARVRLAIHDDGFVEQDDWVHLIVVPDGPVKAYEFVEELEQIERQLQKTVGEKVLVVPAAPD